MSAPMLQDYPSRNTQAAATVSVITTVLNGEKTLPRAIDSVRKQNVPGLEYIIVDAGSTDRTIDIIRANMDVVTFWKSEPDRGISDGFNKGIALATGEYITLLNADDWLSPGQLAFGLETLAKGGSGFVFGDLAYYDGTGDETHRIRGEAQYQRRIRHIMPGLNHPTVIVRRDLYEQHGLFDLEFRLAMDYELLLRFHCANQVGVYDPRMVGHMALAGASDRNTGAALREVRIAAIRHGYPAPLAWLRYLWRLLKWKGRLVALNLPRPIYDRLRGFFNPNYVRGG